MLHVWVGDCRKFGVIRKPDDYFNTEFSSTFTETDFARRLIYECADGSEVVKQGVYRHPIRGNYSMDNLPSVVKTILLVKYDTKVIVDLYYCSDNCLPFLAEIANGQDVTVCLSRYMNFWYPRLPYNEFKDGIHAMNTDVIIRDPLDWMGYYDEHENDVILPDDGDEDKFAWNPKPEDYL